MGCELCGGGDGWLKTCLTPYETRLRICDLCYEEHASELVIVPGASVITARCDECWSYGNPREFVEVHPGGRKDAYSGICQECAERRRGGGEEQSQQGSVRTVAAETQRPGA